MLGTSDIIVSFQHSPLKETSVFVQKTSELIYKITRYIFSSELTTLSTFLGTVESKKNMMKYESRKLLYIYIGVAQFSKSRFESASALLQ